MRAKSYEIIVLKPTAVFLSFLAAQLPDSRVPDLRLLHIDNTAYAIPRRDSNEGTLEEIEKHFSRMFHHEIARWLGDGAHHEIESNFLDFLCCFKCELHNHIILMEPAFNEGKQLVVFRPRMELLHWLKDVAAQEEMADVVAEIKLANLQENATVMVKNFSNLMVIKPFIKNHYYALYATAMSRISNQQDQWPSIDSFQAFSRYFAIEIHTQLIHLDH